MMIELPSEQPGGRVRNRDFQTLRIMLGCLLLSCMLPGWAAQATPVVEKAALDADVDAVVARYHLPGIAVGVIEDGKVVYTRTVGETVVGSGETITSQTLFKIASNSKAMTASTLARLVDVGKLRWDDPVTKYLPTFRMYDPWVTRNMQVRDLLVHNSGLPEGGGDLMLWPEPNDFTRADILSGLGYIKPAYSFRSGYAYDNLLYVVAGEVAAAASGTSYEEVVRHQVFEPLGLSRCRVGEFKRAEVGNIAQPHRRSGDGNVAMREDGDVVPAITSAAAGGIRCSLDDMLAWALNWLVPTPAQLRWLSPEQRRQMWKARTPMPILQRRRDWDDTHYYAYTFGFRVADVDGEWTVSHTGTLGGMYSMMLLLPDRRSGFVFMINGDGGDARTVLGEVLLKHFTAPRNDRGVQSYADELDADASAPSQSHVPDLSGARAVTAAHLQPWLGNWRDPWFGEITICPLGEGVEWRSAKSPRMHGPVSQLGQRYLVRWADSSVDIDAWLDFSASGDKRGLHMAKVDPDGDFSSDYEDLSFTRTGGCE